MTGQKYGVVLSIKTFVKIMSEIEIIVATMMAPNAWLKFLMVLNLLMYNPFTSNPSIKPLVMTSQVKEL